MLEGLATHRAAIALRTALVGKPTDSFVAPRLMGPSPMPGRTIETVRSRGRHVEIGWDDGMVLHTHLRLNGSWDLYHLGERWRKSSDRLSVAIEVEDWVAVCFNAAVTETYREFDRHRHPGFGRLGPDLCKSDADLRESVERIMQYFDPDAPIAEVLLDQHVAQGVGNVYRSEVLWTIQLSPFAAVGSLSQRDVRAVVLESARRLRASVADAWLEHGAHVGGGDGVVHAVYGRNGQRCERCGDTVKVRRVGELRRLLYWCPGCQARGDSRIAPTPPAGIEREMDPHPAASMFLADLPWRRDDQAETG